VAKHTIEDLLFGFKTNITDRLNTGNVNEGNIYYSSMIEPAYLYQQDGGSSASSFTVLTG
jgi:hypothetical protein